MHKAMVERKNSLLTGRNFWPNQTEERRPTASTTWLLRGQERGDNKHNNSKSGIHSEKEKYKLMTTIMSYVHGEQNKEE